jgi:DNA repair exonuclease SbcCD ATPase subunit|tara:strand:+ start:2981 stop:4780 length:1800 start_codon:yes stop_codon:yes gene_type:complete
MGQVIEAELKLKYQNAIEQVEELKKELDQVKESFEANEKAAKDSEKGAKGFGNTLKTIGQAGGIIFLLQKAFELLKNAINSNQQVADTFAVVMGTIGQVFSEIGNVLVGVVTNLTSTTENFDALGRVISNVGKIALAPFKLLIDGLALGFYNAQLAWEQSFLGSGDTEKIEALNQKIDETKQSLVDTTVGIAEAGVAIVSDFGEAVSEVGNVGTQLVEGLSTISVKSIAENVKANEQLKKSAAEARIVNQGLIEQYDRQAEQQRQIRDNDLKSIDDRIKANDDLKATLEEQEKSMLANADLMIQQAELQFQLSGLEEDRLALLEARNEKAAIEAQIEGFMSEQEANRVALLKEKIELQLSEDEAVANRQNIEREFNAEMEQNEVKRIQMMLENLQTERAIEEERLLMKRNAFEEGTQAYIDANNELLDYQQDNANQQQKIEKDLGVAKENQLKSTLGSIASIVGQNSKFGKAIAIVQALQDTYAGANKALAQGGLFGFIGAAAVIAAGIANVKQIAGSKTPNPPASLGARSTGGESTPAISTPTVTTSPPQFSTVGASGTNQLAELLGNQAPPRAYVVSGDVSTAQELDRNIVSSASLG